MQQHQNQSQNQHQIDSLLSTLRSFGWNEHTADAWALHTADDCPSAGTSAGADAPGGLLPGRVTRVDRGLADVLTAEAGTLRAGTADVATDDPVATLCTGDWVVLGGDGNGDWQVRDVLPRRTAFVRATSSSRSEGQVLAANVDHAVIAVPLAVELDLGRLERFVSLAWASGAQPLVVLTKADLVPDADTLEHLRVDAAGAAPGVDVLTVSSATGDGLDVVRAVLGEGTAVLLGVSGAGKSTLANALLGREAQEVRAIRDADGKGRHTTTTRDLLPMPGGGVLIDTPGLRGVGLWDAGEGLGQTFSDVEDLAATCRFHDCAHVAEPGCAVLAAVEDGTLPHRRLESWRKLQRENVRLAARTDARLRAEQRKVFKERQAEGRMHMRAKRGTGGARGARDR